MVVKWSACSPSTQTNQVRIPMMSTVFCSISCLERTEIYEKEPGDGPFKKISRLIMLLLLYQLQQICRLDCSSKTLFCSSSLQLFILRPHERTNERTNKRTNERNGSAKILNFFRKTFRLQQVRHKRRRQTTF